ncbi:MAG: membrane protein insertase YidC [Crocinitomicaceae bacterium]|nr:membrane protein insertase YidC [Crocinitomicaceae bacterium]
MDRNTIVGLVLIGAILSVFSIFNQPSEEERKEAQRKEMAASKEVAKVEADSIAAVEANKDTTQPKVDKAPDSSDAAANIGTSAKIEDTTKKDTVALDLIRLENDKFIVDFNPKGGQIASLYLKEYETFYNYQKKDGKVTPLQLFADGDASNGVTISVAGREINTANQIFEVSKKSKKAISFTHTIEPGKSITFSYTLPNKTYNLRFDIDFKGLKDDIGNKKIQLNWQTAYKKTERLFSEQRRVSTVCYKYQDEGFSYLSEMGDDDIEAEDKLEWVAYKQSYFSSILNPKTPFLKEGTKLVTKNFSDTEKRKNTHLKDYSSDLTLNVPKSDDATVEFDWFFGPNDYEELKSYGEGYDDVLNFGWGLFRWINVYAVQPLFNGLLGTGLGIGLAIFLLTLILKLFLMPVQWKMYVSSAKMKILKPEIEELNKKFPDKADAMKKQTEMMSLYKESGASPLAGCLPMLIQMPILLAVFRFFPSAFELRQRNFLWAEDLSSYDSILELGMSIPFYGDHVSLFTLLMAGTTLVYTFVNSGQMSTPQQPGMPNMKIIMYLFPIMMIFFFNNYSSGLSYYYFISTLFSIVIALAIKKFFVDEDKLKGKMAARKVTVNSKGKKSKSKFQERLEQMQKAQQDKMKKR